MKGLFTLLLTQLLSSPAYSEYDPDLFAAQLWVELESDNWVMVVDNENKIHGWLSYYLLSESSLELIKKHPMDWKSRTHELKKDKERTVLFYANCWCAPWANKRVYRSLAEMANKREPHVTKLASLMYSNKLSIRRYHERRPFELIGAES